MIQKVKEPLPDEYELMKENQILYTYLHLAAEPKLTKVLCERKVKAIAYETIQLENGSLPLSFRSSAHEESGGTNFHRSADMDFMSLQPFVAL
jgi:alanine dehydrogenase